MKSWEDYLSSFDQAQEDVQMTWGPTKPVNKQKQRAINLDNFAKGTSPKPAAVKKLDPQAEAKIKKLEAVISNKGATEGEKAAAQAAINRIKNK